MGDSTQAQATDLKRLAKAANLEPITAAERELLKQALTGDWAKCGPSYDDKDNDPKEADKWGKERRIRAELVAWLCTDEQARKHVHPRGILVYGADITGPLDLSFVKMPFPLRFEHCRVQKDINLSRAEVSELDLQGSAVQGITAHGLVVKNDVFLIGGFTANGELGLIGAQIGGDLDCEAGSFVNEGGMAINADRVNVKGDVFLRRGSDAPWDETAFTAKGEVNLLGAQIGGQLSCNGGVFSNPKGGALYAERIIVRGSVWLGDGFKADGRVHLLGAQIGGDLECSGGNLQDATLDLTDASAATLYDSGLNDPVDPTQPAPAATVWPPRDKDHYLLLDGFTYGRIASPGRINVYKRLDWLARQPQSPFHSQPYLQLAKVLRESGDDKGAQTVLIEMEALSWKGSIWSPVLKYAIGYGYDPIRAFWLAVLLTGVGWIIYRKSYLAGGIVPTDKDACAKFREPDAEIPGHYPSFSPLVYSVENSLPLVKLGQGDKWQPDPEPEASPPQKVPAPKLGYRGTWAWPPDKLQSAWRALLSLLTAIWGRMPERIRAAFAWTVTMAQRLLIAVGLRPSTDVNHEPASLSRFGTSPRFVTWFLWFQILLGWLLATLFVAGVSGIVHK